MRGAIHRTGCILAHHHWTFTEFLHGFGPAEPELTVRPPHESLVLRRRVSNGDEFRRMRPGNVTAVLGPRYASALSVHLALGFFSSNRPKSSQEFSEGLERCCRAHLLEEPHSFRHLHLLQFSAFQTPRLDGFGKLRHLL